jgi:hypothetical protein
VKLVGFANVSAALHQLGKRLGRSSPGLEVADYLHSLGVREKGFRISADIGDDSNAPVLGITENVLYAPMQGIRIIENFKGHVPASYKAAYIRPCTHKET